MDINWDGEDIPPVGTVCEVWCQTPHESWAHHVGKEATIVAHDGMIAVYRVEGDDGGLEYHGLGGGSDGYSYPFRPLHTPEQIAAEEREKAIRDITNDSLGLCDYHGACFLYDAGYRKQENNDAKA